MMRLALFSSATLLQVAVSVRSCSDVRIFWHQEDLPQMPHNTKVVYINVCPFHTDNFMSQLFNFMKMKAISADLKIIYPFFIDLISLSNLDLQKVCNVIENYVWSICSDFRFSYQGNLTCNQSKFIVYCQNQIIFKEHHVIFDWYCYDEAWKWIICKNDKKSFLG